jgi:hypothetical protein
MDGEERRIATPNSWRKVKVLPERRAEIHVDLVCTPAEFERVRGGHVPGEMEDKWFIFTEGLRTSIHRSWTGFCYCILEFQTCPDGFRVARAWVNRDPDQYGGLGGLDTLAKSGMKYFGDLPNRCSDEGGLYDDEYDSAYIGRLVRGLLLEEKWDFLDPGPYRDRAIASARREVRSKQRPWWKFW